MVSAKRAGRQPRELASDLVDVITADPPAHVESAEVAGPGFVNFRLANSWLHEVLTTTVDAGVEHYACLDIGAGQRVDVEFVSANPTGPLHAGHARGAIYGDALVRLPRTPAATRCTVSSTERPWRADGDASPSRSLPERRVDRCPRTAITATTWAIGLPVCPPTPTPLEWGYQQALADQRAVLERLDVRFDTWFSRAEHGRVRCDRPDPRRPARAWGGLRPPTAQCGCGPPSTATTKDRVLVKSDGEFTYLLPDIAYHRDKLARGFDLLIDVWGCRPSRLRARA